MREGELMLSCVSLFCVSTHARTCIEVLPMPNRTGMQQLTAALRAAWMPAQASKSSEVWSVPPSTST